MSESFRNSFSGKSASASASPGFMINSASCAGSASNVIRSVHTKYLRFQSAGRRNSSDL